MSNTSQAQINKGNINVTEDYTPSHRKQHSNLPNNSDTDTLGDWGQGYQFTFGHIFM